MAETILSRTGMHWTTLSAFVKVPYSFEGKERRKEQIKVVLHEYESPINFPVEI